MNSKKQITTLLLLLALVTLLISCSPVVKRDPQVASAEPNKILSRLSTPVTVRIFPESQIYGDVTVDLNYQGWPTVCRGEGNTLYAVSSVRTQHIDIFGAIGFCKSTDGGATWSQIRIIKDTPLDDRDAGIVDLGNGHLMVTWFTHDAYKYRDGGAYGAYRSSCTAEQLAAIDARLDTLTGDAALGFSYVMHSTDGGETWGEPIKIPVTLPHGATLLQDGKTLICAGVPWNYKRVTGNDPTSKHFHVFTSSDGGYTWNYRSIFGYAPQYNDGYEAHVIQLKDGSFVAAFRYNHPDETGMRCYTVTSNDGITWTPPILLEQGRGAPPHLLQLGNGAVLMTYACRLEDQCEIRGCLSTDGGKTWGEEIFISRAEKQNTDHGYPSTVELDDGTLITAYYQMYKTDRYCSFLYTKWRLNEPST